MTIRSSEQEAAEAEVQHFREELGPFVVAAEETRMPMVFTDAREPGNPIVFVNDSFLKLTQYGRDEVLGQSFNFLMARSTDKGALTRIETEFEGDDHNGSEICYRRKDGSEFWASIFISPVRDKGGNLVQHFASFADLTKHKDEQEQSRMLIDELNHRVKNTLATVQSIVSQALRNETDPGALREAIDSRLLALSRSHDLLTRENWDSAGLHDVINAALEPFGIANGRKERFVVTGSNVRFPPNAALALGIAFHELATNAVKYGAFSDQHGCITVDWAMAPSPNGNRLILHWRENGGPPVVQPTRKGFGSRVIERGLTHELDATVEHDYRPEGLVCTIDMPAPPGAHRG